MRVHDTEVDGFGAMIINYIQHLDFTPILPKIEQVVRNSIDRNFSEGGRFGSGKFGGGSEKWKQSYRAKKQSGQTLNDKGTLAKSIRVRVSQVAGSILVEIGSNLEYAKIHQFGGHIKVNARSEIFIRTRYTRGAKKGQYEKLSKDMSKRKMGQGYSYGDMSIDIPARPYLVLQDEDVVQILNLIRTLF